MKTFTTTLLITLSLLSTASYAELKAAFINSAIILRDAPQAKAASDAMMNEFKDREQKLRQADEELKQAAANWQKDSAIMSDDQKKKKEEELLEKQRKLRFDAQSLKEDVDLRRKQEIQKLRDSITGVIKDYAQKHGYDLIFTEGVAYADAKVDITDEILDVLKKMQ
jgi:outer membrane protein